MSICPKCGQNVPDGAKFCPQCSAPVTEAASEQPGFDPFQSNYNQKPDPYGTSQPDANQQPGYTYNPQPGYAQQPYNYNAQPAPGGIQNNSTALLVWSVINLICCCLPLGIAGLVFTLTAKNDIPEEQQKKLKSAFICNIIGTIGGLLFIILSFVSGLFSALV